IPVLTCSPARPVRKADPWFSRNFALLPPIFASAGIKPASASSSATVYSNPSSATARTRPISHFSCSQYFKLSELIQRPGPMLEQAASRMNAGAPMVELQSALFNDDDVWHFVNNPLMNGASACSRLRPRNDCCHLYEIH